MIKITKRSSIAHLTGPMHRSAALQEFFISCHRRERIELFQCHHKSCQKPDLEGGQLMSRLRLWQGPLPQHALPNGRASDTLFNRSKHSQTADAAVGEDIETHM